MDLHNFEIKEDINIKADLSTQTLHATDFDADIAIISKDDASKKYSSTYRF